MINLKSFFISVIRCAMYDVRLLRSTVPSLVRVLWDHRWHSMNLFFIFRVLIISLLWSAQWCEKREKLALQECSTNQSILVLSHLASPIPNPLSSVHTNWTASIWWLFYSWSHRFDAFFLTLLSLTVTISVSLFILVFNCLLLCIVAVRSRFVLIGNAQNELADPYLWLL